MKYLLFFALFVTGINVLSKLDPSFELNVAKECGKCGSGKCGGCGGRK